MSSLGMLIDMLVGQPSMSDQKIIDALKQSEARVFDHVAAAASSMADDVRRGESLSAPTADAFGALRSHVQEYAGARKAAFVSSVNVDAIRKLLVAAVDVDGMRDRLVSAGMGSMNHVNVSLILGLLDITPEQLAEMVEKAQNAMSHRKNQT